MSIDGSAYLINTDFWSKQRVNVGYTVPALADKLKICPQSLNNWFSGRVIPRNRAHIYSLCKCLEVDYFEGLKQFNLSPNYLLDQLAIRGISTKKFSELMRVSPQTVHSWTHHIAPIPSDRLSEIAELLDIDPTEFFRGIRNDLHPDTSEVSTAINNTASIVNNSEYFNSSDIATIEYDSTPATEDNIDTSEYPKQIFNALYNKIPFDTLLELVELAGSYSEFKLSTYLDDIYAGALISTRQAYEFVISTLRSIVVTSDRY